MSQKFFRGHRVKIASKLPFYMSHFSGAGSEAIVKGSYEDLCSGRSQTKEYSLLVLKPSPHSSAWYPQGLLTLVSKDRDAGEKMLQKYQSR